MWGLAPRLLSGKPRPWSMPSQALHPQVPRAHSLPADTLAVTGHIPTPLIDQARFLMWTTPPVSFLGLDVRLEPKGSSLGFRGGLALFHAPCGLVRMLRRFNTSDHTASRITTRIAPEQQIVAIMSRHEMSRNKIPGKMSPLGLDFDILPRCM